MEPRQLASNSAIRLSQLTRQIQYAIEGVFCNSTFWIIADISNYSYKAENNYHYFELVEKDISSSRIVTKVAGRAWGNGSINISNFEKLSGQKFKNDIHVLIQVSVQYHISYGLQLNLLDIDTNFTIGQFEQQRNLTLEKLLQNNSDFINKEAGFYITRNNSLYLSEIVQRIAVISAETSAGYQDFKHTLDHNSFNYIYKVDHYFTKVQGSLNAKLLLNKLVEIFNSNINYDAVIIVRGGGSQSDFILFDDYELSRAIAKFPIPIITGIGHQKNETIVDLMAHTSTKTPTKAAELIIAHNRKFEEKLLSMQKMILIKTQQLFAFHTKSLFNIKSIILRDVLRLLNENQRNISSISGLIINRPNMILKNKYKDLENLYFDLKKNQRIFLNQNKMNLEHMDSLIKLMSPQNILKKGFAIIKIDGKIINNADSIIIGQELLIQLTNTEIKTIVKSKNNI